MVFAGKHKIIISDEIVTEYRAVLERPKFSINSSIIESFFTRLPDFSTHIAPKKHLMLCKDPDDNIFLDVAFAGQATYLVTGNLRHFPQVTSFTHIVSAKQFIDLQTSVES